MIDDNAAVSARWCASGAPTTARSCSRAADGPVDPSDEVNDAMIGDAIADGMTDGLAARAFDAHESSDRSSADRRRRTATGAPDQSFRVRATSDGWAVSGEIDISTAPCLAAALRAPRPDLRGGRVCVDLAHVHFIDSQGLAVLLDGHRTIRGPHDRFVIRRASPLVRRLVEIADLQAVLRVRPDSAHCRRRDRR